MSSVFRAQTNRREPQAIAAEQRPVPAAKPAQQSESSARPLPVQDTWLTAQRSQSIAVRLNDGKILTGVLVNWDAYCLIVQIEGQRAPTLVFKSSVAFILPK